MQVVQAVAGRRPSPALLEPPLNRMSLSAPSGSVLKLPSTQDVAALILA